MNKNLILLRTFTASLQIMLLLILFAIITAFVIVPIHVILFDPTDLERSDFIALCGTIIFGLLCQFLFFIDIKSILNPIKQLVKIYTNLELLNNINVNGCYYTFKNVLKQPLETIKLVSNRKFESYDYSAGYITSIIKYCDMEYAESVVNFDKDKIRYIYRIVCNYDSNDFNTMIWLFLDCNVQQLQLIEDAIFYEENDSIIEKLATTNMSHNDVKFFRDSLLKSRVPDSIMLEMFKYFDCGASKEMLDNILSKYSQERSEHLFEYVNSTMKRIKTKE